MPDSPTRPDDAPPLPGPAPFRADHAESRVGAMPSRADRLLLSRMPVLPGRKPAPGPADLWLTKTQPASAPPPRRRRRFLLVPAGVLLVGVLLSGSYLAIREYAAATPRHPVVTAEPGWSAAAVPVAPTSAAAVTAEPSPSVSAGPSVSRAAPAVHAPSATISASPVASGSASHSSSPSATAATPAPPQGRVNSSMINLAAWAGVSSSSQQSADLSPDHATDGDRWTRWASAAADPQWIELDLRVAWQLNVIHLYWGRAYAVRYRIDGSLDGKSWSPIWTTTTGEGGAVTIDATGTVARYVRMYGEKRATRYSYSLYEIEVR